MYKKLIIVESPSKCKKIELFAGPEFKCLSTCGHIYTLSHIKHIDVNDNYKPTYTLIKNKRKRLDEIQKAIHHVGEENVYIATDPDREGEAIGWHLCLYFKLDVEITKRVVFNEITKNAVLSAIERPLIINMLKVKSQQARQVIDLIIGFKTCPILWKYLGIGEKSNPVSSGRCQTPCLRLVYDLKEKMCDKLTSIDYKLGFIIDDPLYVSCNYIPPSSPRETILFDDDIKYVFDFLGNINKYIMTRSPVKQIHLKPPSPLSTALLQQKGHQYLGFSPKLVMSLAQHLYEKGLITYMRTDSNRYSREFINHISSFISSKEEYKPYLLKNPNCLETNLDNKHSQDGHESIRPTDMWLDISKIDKLSSNHKKLYNYIYYHSLQTLMKDAIEDTYTITVSPDTSGLPFNNHNSLIFTSRQVCSSYKGWKCVRLVNSLANNMIDNVIYNKYLNILTHENSTHDFYPDNLIINLTSYLSSNETLYSEATLVNQLVKRDIGRPSTYASLIDKIQQRHYVINTTIEPKYINTMCYNYSSKNKVMTQTPCILGENISGRRLVIQEQGQRVSEFCYDHFEPLFNYKYTSLMEQKLDAIAWGNDTYDNVCNQCDIMVSNCIETIKKKDLHIKETLNSKPRNNETLMGMYKDSPLILKSGLYGYYAEHCSVKYSLKGMNIIDREDFSCSTIISFIEREQITKEQTILREVDSNISIRRGKRGKSDYIMILGKPSNYKRNKPTFISLKKFDGDYKQCSVDLLMAFIESKTT